MRFERCEFGGIWFTGKSKCQMKWMFAANIGFFRQRSEGEELNRNEKRNELESFCRENQMQVERKGGGRQNYYYYYGEYLKISEFLTNLAVSLLL